MYWAVHGPMPGSASKSAIKRPGSTETENAIEPSPTARARRRMHSARVRITPTSSIDAPASCAGEGNSRARPPPSSTGVPKRRARRPAMVVAAATDTCWPRMARTDISKPFHAPGQRMPGCCSRIPPSNGSLPRHLVITAGSASRSNRRRTRSTIAGCAPTRGNVTATSSADSRDERLTANVPLRPSISMVRR